MASVPAAAEAPDSAAPDVAPVFSATDSDQARHFVHLRVLTLSGEEAHHATRRVWLDRQVGRLRWEKPPRSQSSEGRSQSWRAQWRVSVCRVARLHFDVSEYRIRRRSAERREFQDLQEATEMNFPSLFDAPSLGCL